MVDLLVLVHERGCERELADGLSIALEDGDMPDMVSLLARFCPDPAALPDVTVHLATLAAHDDALPRSREAA